MRDEYPTQLDPLVVRTEDLKNVLDRWIEDFRSRHDGKTRIKKRVYGSHGGSPQINGWEATELEFQTGAIGFMEKESGVNIRRIWGILNLETLHTSLAVADPLIQGIEMTYVYHNGECPIIPNPRWNQERWIKWMESRGCV